MFETNIRVVGGFLSLYDLTKEPLYLKKAQEVADMLCEAFNTDSGYPKVMMIMPLHV